MTMQQPERTYLAIDLKSFYASVECVDRGLDPLTTNLVVADESRTNKTICLAVTPSLKALGIGGRARLFEVEQRVREVNELRKDNAKRLTGKSVDSEELAQHADWAVDYIVAPPRMAYYMDVSSKVYRTYLKYVAPDDILPYSVDEVFIDITEYMRLYGHTAHELAVIMIRDVLSTTGITATAGIGTNMYLSKVAMDIVAKHAQADKDGVRIGELDEMSYRRTLWSHKPLTSFWRVGRGTAAKLSQYGVDTMGKIARLSLTNEDLLYKLFGVNAELLIDHAWGWEPCTIAQAKSYKPEVHSLSNGQVLQSPYSCEKARIVVAEMADNMALSLVGKHLVCDQIVLTVGYDAQNFADNRKRAKYKEIATVDRYGRQIPRHSNGTINLGRYTSSSKIIGERTLALFDRIINPELTIRRLNLTANHVVGEEFAQSSDTATVQLDLFAEQNDVDNKKETENKTEFKEHRIQETLLAIKERFGKNAILKGLNLQEGATAKQRNAQIGGHRA